MLARPKSARGGGGGGGRDKGDASGAQPLSRTERERARELLGEDVVTAAVTRRRDAPTAAASAAASRPASALLRANEAAFETQWATLTARVAQEAREAERARELDKVLWRETRLRQIYHRRLRRLLLEQRVRPRSAGALADGDAARLERELDEEEAAVGLPREWRKDGSYYGQVATSNAWNNEAKISVRAAKHAFVPEKEAEAICRIEQQVARAAREEDADVAVRRQRAAAIRAQFRSQQERNFARHAFFFKLSLLFAPAHLRASLRAQTRLRGCASAPLLRRPALRVHIPGEDKAGREAGVEKEKREEQEEEEEEGEGQKRSGEEDEKRQEEAAVAKGSAFLTRLATPREKRLSPRALPADHQDFRGLERGRRLLAASQPAQPGQRASARRRGRPPRQGGQDGDAKARSGAAAQATAAATARLSSEIDAFERRLRRERREFEFVPYLARQRVPRQPLAWEAGATQQ